MNDYKFDDYLKKRFFDDLFGKVVVKNNGICSTCKYFNGKSCSKGRSFGGFATKLDDCGEWEVCGGK